MFYSTYLSYLFSYSERFFLRLNRNGLPKCPEKPERHCSLFVVSSSYSQSLLCWVLKIEVGLNCYSVVDSELLPKLLYFVMNIDSKGWLKCIAELPTSIFSGNTWTLI